MSKIVLTSVLLDRAHSSTYNTAAWSISISLTSVICLNKMTFVCFLVLVLIRVLTSTEEGRKSSGQSQTPSGNPSANTVNEVVSKTKCSAAVGSIVDEPQRDFENDVETYLDERGRVRVSRLRAMGIRMTRDLQRNLDLMKEIEEERVCTAKNGINGSTNYDGVVDTQGCTPDRIQTLETSYEEPNGMTCANEKNEETVLCAGTSMEISFEGNGEHEFGGEDVDLFAHLVAGHPVMDFSVNNSLSKKESMDSDSEPEWEEGVIEDEGGALSNRHEIRPLLADDMIDENELEWEEGSLDTREEASPCPAEYRKIVSKGALEEEADFQEAIRRSLQDLEDQGSVDTPNQGEKSGPTPEAVTLSTEIGFVCKENDRKEPEAPSMFSNQQPENIKSPDSFVDMNILETNNSLEVLLEKAYQSCPGLDLLMQDTSGNETLHQDVCRLGSPIQDKDVYTIEGQLTGDEVAAGSIFWYTPTICDSVSKWSLMPIFFCADDLQNGFEATVDEHANGTSESKGVSHEELMKDMDTAEELVGGVHEYISTKREEPLSKTCSSDGRKEHIEVTEARLEEEILVLGEESKELGDKQRKLERNAESVSSEMFAECQVYCHFWCFVAKNGWLQIL